MAALKKKEDDMRAMEERYKMYLEKARNVSEKMFFSLVTVVLKAEVSLTQERPFCSSG